MFLKERSGCGVTFNHANPKTSCDLPVTQGDLKTKHQACALVSCVKSQTDAELYKKSTNLRQGKDWEVIVNIPVL